MTPKGRGRKTAYPVRADTEIRCRRDRFRNHPRPATGGELSPILHSSERIADTVEAEDTLVLESVREVLRESVRDVRVTAGSPERYCKGGRGLESYDCYSRGGLRLVIMVHLVV
jgi:hypothetical protein